jgi:glutathione S-transferase
MILYGRWLSPYTRRVGVWLALQGRAFEHRPLSVLDDAAAIAALSPVSRVPVLEADDGARLIEAWAICDWLDETADRPLVPRAGAARRAVLQRIALASAGSDKAVALVYEKNRRDPAFHVAAVIDKVSGQARGALAALEAAAPADGWFGGDAPDGSDVAVICLVDFATATNPALAEGLPKLAALSARANALPAFGDRRP